MSTKGKKSRTIIEIVLTSNKSLVVSRHKTLSNRNPGSCGNPERRVSLFYFAEIVLSDDFFDSFVLLYAYFLKNKNRKHCKYQL